jgi:hypothetical protein
LCIPTIAIVGIIVSASPNVLAIAVISAAVLLILSGLILTYPGIKITHVRACLNAIPSSINQGFVMMDRDRVITDNSCEMQTSFNSKENYL